MGYVRFLSPMFKSYIQTITSVKLAVSQLDTMSIQNTQKMFQLDSPLSLLRFCGFLTADQVKNNYINCKLICVSRHSPRTKTTNQPTNRAPNELILYYYTILLLYYSILVCLTVTALALSARRAFGLDNRKKFASVRVKQHGKTLHLPTFLRKALVS